jgi:hypothetical protein
MEAISGASVLAPVNISDALAVISHTSVNTVADEGMGIVSGTNSGEAVAARALVSEVSQKNEGEKPARR